MINKELYILFIPNMSRRNKMSFLNKTETGLSGIVFRIYRDMVKYESIDTMQTKSSEGLTVNELHLIECIRLNTSGGNGPAISTIANALDITRPSATVAVNKLEKKKMVTKSDSAEDGRSVRVKLTAKGEKALEAHTSFQKKFAGELKAELGEEGFEKLVNTFGALGDVLDKKIDDLTGRTQRQREKEKKDSEKAGASAKKTASAAAKTKNVKSPAKRAVKRKK